MSIIRAMPVPSRKVKMTISKKVATNHDKIESCVDQLRVHLELLVFIKKLAVTYMM